MESPYIPMPLSKDHLPFSCHHNTEKEEGERERDGAFMKLNIQRRSCDSFLHLKHLRISKHTISRQNTHHVKCLLICHQLAVLFSSPSLTFPYFIILISLRLPPFLFCFLISSMIVREERQRQAGQALCLLRVC